MQASATRKLIDIRQSVFQVLTIKARKKGLSLKRYIEEVLEEDAKDLRIPEEVSDRKILSLIGIARQPDQAELLSDERLQYLLSK